MQEIIYHFLTNHRLIGYAIVFILMFVEGDVSLFTIALLVRRRFFDPGDMFLVALLGTLCGDFLWYQIGTIIQRYPRLSAKIERVARPFDEHLIKNPLRTILISKFTYGIHHFILTRAGHLRLPLKEFLKSDILSAMVWVLTIGGMGYLSGTYFNLIKHYFHYSEILILILSVAFVLLDRLVLAKRLKKEI